jgi:hypothetical protein
MQRRRHAHVAVACGVGGLPGAEQHPPQRGVDQGLGALALLIGIVEELLDDDALLVHDIDAGEGDPVEGSAVLLHLRVQDAVAADDRRVDVREERVGNVVRLGEGGQCGHVIVGDRVELDAGFLELRPGVAQLTELRHARRSPDRRAVEDDGRLRAAPVLVKAHPAAGLVRQVEVREPLPDPGACRLSVRQALARGMTQGCRRLEAQLVGLVNDHAPMVT